MKKYLEPELFIIELSEDVLSASSGGNDPFGNDMDWGGLEDDV